MRANIIDSSINDYNVRMLIGYMENYRTATKANDIFAEKGARNDGSNNITNGPEACLSFRYCQFRCPSSHSVRHKDISVAITFIICLVLTSDSNHQEV